MDAPTVTQTATDVAAALAAGDNATALRLAFDFVRVFDGVPLDRRPGSIAHSPAACGDPRYDALLAALVEHLCARDGLPVPAWVEEPDRFLGTWWFVAGLRSLHASALAQSPISFARRGVIVCDGALSYA
jgi:hypothetical protein